jgi:hypothetical protein
MEQCAGGRDVLSAVGVGKEPIVADAVASQVPHKPTNCAASAMKLHTLRHHRVVQTADRALDDWRVKNKRLTRELFRHRAATRFQACAPPSVGPAGRASAAGSRGTSQDGPPGARPPGSRAGPHATRKVLCVIKIFSFCPLGLPHAATHCAGAQVTSCCAQIKPKYCN